MDLENFLRHGGNHLGVDVAGRDGVDGDALGGAFEGQGLREAVHAGLGGRVVGLAHLALAAVDRRDVDDAAEAAGAHGVDDEAAHVEDRVEIDVDHFAPLLGRHLVKHCVAGDAGVVDDDVDRTEGLGDLSDALGALVVVADVPLVDRDAGLDLKLLGGSVVAGIVRGDAVALVLECDRDGVADATRSPVTTATRVMSANSLEQVSD